ncbi:MAG: hypothetical protein L0Y56_14505 [Nitrospira sp.]|nr:hypothetical protein [Nitrospira sp.]
MFKLFKVIGLVILGLVWAGLAVDNVYAEAAIQNIKLTQEDKGTQVDFEVVVYNSDTLVYQIIVEWELESHAKPELHNLVVTRCMSVGQHKLSDRVLAQDVVKASVYFDPKPENCLNE